MSGKCADCLHWHRDGDGAICKGWGICLKADMRDGKARNPPTTAVAAGHCVEAWLETAPTHGCTMWEEKE